MEYIVIEELNRRLHDTQPVGSSLGNLNPKLYAFGQPGATQYEMIPYIILPGKEPETQ